MDDKEEANEPANAEEYADEEEANELVDAEE